MEEKQLHESGMQKVKQIRSNKIKHTKHTLQAVFLLLFLLILTVTGLLFIVLPKKETSEIEQRKLASFPHFSLKSVWDGSFTAGMNTYYSDNMPFREQLVKTKFALEDFRGVRIGDIRLYEGGAENQSENTLAPTTPVNKDNLLVLQTLKKPTAPDILPEIDLNNPYYTESGKHFDIFDKEELHDKFGDYLNMDKEALEGEQRGNLFVVGDTALEIFYGNEAVSKDYADVINTYKKALGSAVTVYNLVIPNHFEFGLPQKYKGKIGRDEKPFLDLIKNSLDSSVVFVDVYDTLKDHYEKGEYLYFRTDHHWTGLGAYRAYEKFCEYALLKPLPLSAYETRTSTNFLGTLYNSSLDKNLAAHPDTVEYYVTDLPYIQTNTQKDGVSSYQGSLISEYKSGKTNGYLTFMGGDIPLATIKTENKNGKKIIVFKESYGNAFVPFLVPHYETVYVADIRSFPYNALSFIKDNGIGEVMFLNNIMSANTSARVANILGLMTK